MMKMRRIFLFIMVIMLGLSVVACNCGAEEGPVSKDGEDVALEEVDALLEDLSDIGVDMSLKTLDDFDVPSAEIDIPDIELGSLSLDIDYDITQGLPSISVPNVAGSISPPPGIDFSTPPPGFVPDDTICAQFDTVPDCSFVSEQYRDICEQCKNR